MTSRTLKQQAGATLIELSWAMALGVIVAGTLFAAQRTSVDSFNGAIMEHRATGTLRDGVKAIRTEVRSARPNSVEVGSTSSFFGTGSDPFLKFQSPIDFDYATGVVTWGADTTEDAFVGYYIEDDEIARYVVIDTTRQVETRTVLIDDIVDDGSQPPVSVVWIESKKLVALTMQVAAPAGARADARRVNTMIRVEPVFDY